MCLELVFQLFSGLKSTPIYCCPVCNKKQEYANNLDEIPTNCHVIGHILLDEASGDFPSKITFDNISNGVCNYSHILLPCEIFDQLNYLYELVLCMTC